MFLRSARLWDRPRQQQPRRRQRLQRRGVVALGSEELVKGVEAGSKVRVCKPVTVYHSPKLGSEFNLEGQEGTVMDVRSPSSSGPVPPVPRHHAAWQAHGLFAIYCWSGISGQPCHHSQQSCLRAD